MGFGNIFRFLYTGLLARWVGVEFLGIYSLANAVTRLTEMFGKFGLDSGVLRYVSMRPVAEDQIQIRNDIRSALSMGFVFSLLVMVVQVLLSGWLVYSIFHGTPLLRTVIIINAFTLPFSVLTSIAASATQGFKLLKYKVFVTNIFVPVVLLMTMIVVYFLISSEMTIILPMAISAIAGFVAIFIFLKKLTHIRFSSLFPITYSHEILKFSYPLMFITIIGTFMHWLDIMMLGYFTDTSTVGLYHPATRAAGLLRIVLVAFMGIFTPMMSEYHRKNDLIKMNRLYKLVVRWIISLSLPFAIIMILYSKKVMLLFGVQYLSSADVLSILTLAAFIQSCTASGGSTLFMAGFSKVNLINSIVVLILNVILNFLWIPQFGIMGAAYATLVSMTVLAIMRLIEVKWIVKIQPFSIKMLKPFIAGSGMILVLYFIKPIVFSMHTILTLLITITVGLVTFLILLWMMKFDNDDKEIWTGISMLTNKRKNHEN